MPPHSRDGREPTKWRYPRSKSHLFTGLTFTDHKLNLVFTSTPMPIYSSQLH
jgi:hypothetical protein